MAARDHTGTRIEVWLVEGVRHLPDQPLGGSDRQARVSIERDDVADTGGQRRSMTIDWQKRRIGGAAKQSVEFVQFAAFALPADPFFLALVPDTSAMEKEEARANSGPARSGRSAAQCRRLLCREDFRRWRYARPYNPASRRSARK